MKTTMKIEKRRKEGIAVERIGMEKKSPKLGHGEQPLKGAFVSVLLMGGFIALVWAAVFAVYLSRLES